MDRHCDVCAKPLDAQRSDARFCSDRCRKRAARGGIPRADASVPPEGRSGQGSGTLDAVRFELTAAGRLDSWLGQAALSLAERIDASTAVMGYAALIKELRSTMDAALAGAETVADPLDELRARRDRKLATG